MLEGVDLLLPAGKTVAIVGENGAGKTTLVKLLAAFYEPTAGRITVDGVDLRRLRPGRAWRDRIAAGFQDFARFELLARETRRRRRPARVDDRRGVRDGARPRGARRRRRGAPATGSTRSSGTATSTAARALRRAVAEARARPRDDARAPLLLVLDEPTAASTRTTEHALFERFAGRAQARPPSPGAITILVSHRFSTVRMADLILVVDDGRIGESGTHDELMRCGGLYAELYELQAAAYR